MPRPSPFSSKTKRVSGTPVKKPALPAGKSPAKSIARKRPVPDGTQLFCYTNNTCIVRPAKAAALPPGHSRPPRDPPLPKDDRPADP